MSEIKANRLSLNNRCEFYFDSPNAFVPVAHCSPKDLPEVMDRVACDVVIVTYRTTDDKKEQDRDCRKYTNRLVSLFQNWSRNAWTSPVIDGHTIYSVRSCTMIWAGGKR